jgi:cyclic lactone autoinducer peptide
MKKFISRLFIFTVTTLLFLASVTAASACLFTSYQTEVPETLRK